MSKTSGWPDGRNPVRGCGIDVTARTVELADGTDIPYDGLVIATGTRARRFTDDPNEYTLRTLDEAAALGCMVRLIQFGLPMLPQMGPVIARVLTEVARDNGVKIIDAMVTFVHPTPSGFRVVLDNAETSEAEVIVSAIGDAPNIEWLEGSGLLQDSRLVRRQALPRLDLGDRGNQGCRGRPPAR